VELRLVPILVTSLAVFGAPLPANAQPRALFAGGAAGSSLTRADFVDGRSGTLGVFGGFGLTPWMDVEAEFDWLGAGLGREYSGTSVILAEGPVVTRFNHARSMKTLASVGVSFHTSARHRVTPRLFVGLTSYRVADQVVLEHVSVPPGVTREQLDRILPPQAPWSRSIGGPTVGVSLAIAAGPHIVILPDVRFDYASLADEINNMLRGSIKVAWRFR